MSNTKKLTVTAICIALCVLLPSALHMIPNAGSILLPMHIPVLVCGLLVSWQYGLICGLMGPLLSSLITGMPPMAVLPGMMLELAVYGSVTALLMSALKMKNEYLKLYLSLIIAMLAGRILGGVSNALIFRAGDYSLQLWATASFVTSIPGIILQLMFIPSLIFTLRRNGFGESDSGRSVQVRHG